MTVVAVGTVRSCAATTTAAGLAMLWPDEGRRVLIEADPAGGTMAAACGLAVEPGLVSLAAAARRQDDPALVFDHAQPLPDRTPVVCAPPGGDQARSALSMLEPLLARLGDLPAVAAAVVDCGRLEPDGSNTRLFKESDLSVLVCRPQLGDLNAVAAFFETQQTAVRPLVVVAGPGPYPSMEIAEALGVEVVGQLPWDPDAASGLISQPPSSRRLTRSPLVRALRSLAGDLAGRRAAAASDDPKDSVRGEDPAMIVGAG